MLKVIDVKLLPVASAPRISYESPVERSETLNGDAVVALAPDPVELPPLEASPQLKESTSNEPFWPLTADGPVMLDPKLMKYSRFPPWQPLGPGGGGPGGGGGGGGGVADEEEDEEDVEAVAPSIVTSETVEPPEHTAAFSLTPGLPVRTKAKDIATSPVDSCAPDAGVTVNVWEVQVDEPVQLGVAEYPDPAKDVPLGSDVRLVLLRETV
jgi:hypothetical protein